MQKNRSYTNKKRTSYKLLFFCLWIYEPNIIKSSQLAVNEQNENHSNGLNINLIIGPNILQNDIKKRN